MLQNAIFSNNCHRFLQTRRPFCHGSISVKALKEMHLALQQKNGVVFFLFAAQQFVLQPIYYYNVMPSVL